MRTILIVDDDERLLRLVGEMVKSVGYDVIKVNSPAAAVDEFEKNSGRIDLLLSDVVMPGMSGIELGERLRAKQPRLAVVLMTGCAECLNRSYTILEKPFGLDQLRKLLTGALTGC